MEDNSRSERRIGSGVLIDETNSRAVNLGNPGGADIMSDQNPRHRYYTLPASWSTQPLARPVPEDRRPEDRRRVRR
ncbi:hypothetical protein CH292_26260 [Rhodococcus sp. 14-2470-1a]|nr:hypothetical protein CH292_26260 [Rhodococcus sp. 14-2470-1a]